jgi:hypothetical protein
MLTPQLHNDIKLHVLVVDGNIQQVLKEPYVTPQIHIMYIFTSRL